MFYKLIAKKLATERHVSLKRVILIDFVAITSVFSVVYILVSLVIGYTPGIVAMVANFVLNVMALMLYIKRTTTYSTTADLFIANACLVAIFPCTYFSGGHASPVLSWFLLVPIVSLLLHGLKRQTYMWLSVALGFILYFCIAGVAGQQFAAHYDTSWYKEFYLLCVVGLASIVFLVTMVFEKEKGRAMVIVQKKNEEITDSINYAKHLQEAILPPYQEIRSHLKKSFILFKPKDVVSGDFYWFERVGSTSYIAVADCTGHGVPGAMLSVVCSNALNRCVKEFGITAPAEILDRTRGLVIETFAKGGGDIKDGMDISLVAITGHTAIFAGANNPLWIVRQTNLLTEEQKAHRTSVIGDQVSLVVHNADRQSISFSHSMTEFKQQQITLYHGDRIYLFTDGFADQFGGMKGKKFKYRPFKKYLVSLVSTPMNKQQRIIDNAFEDWKGEYEQTDDVCLIGVEV